MGAGMRRDRIEMSWRGVYFEPPGARPKGFTYELRWDRDELR